LLATARSRLAEGSGNVSWGVIPVMSEEFYSVDVLFHYAKRAAIETGLVQKGDKIVLTGGTPNGKSGNSNLINVETIS
jgi:pyruvate kinase